MTFAFGLGQPALMEAVGDAVADDVRGVALGIATLFFLVGGGVGSAVVGGLGDVLGMPTALLLLAALPLIGLVALVPQLARAGVRGHPVGLKPAEPRARRTGGPVFDPVLRIMTKQDPERRLELSPAQVAGSALAAMSGAVFISWAGTAGTLIGAAAGSVIATVGSATYTWSLRRSRDAARRTAERMRQTALVANGRPRSVAAGPLREDQPAADDQHGRGTARPRRWDLPWGKVALASLAVMVAGMAGITAVEAVTGRSVSSYTGRRRQLEHDPGQRRRIRAAADQGARHEAHQGDSHRDEHADA